MRRRYTDGASPLIAMLDLFDRGVLLTIELYTPGHQVFLPVAPSLRKNVMDINAFIEEGHDIGWFPRNEITTTRAHQEGMNSLVGSERRERSVRSLSF